MAVCGSCGEKLSFFGSLGDRKPKRCSKCKQKYTQILRVCLQHTEEVFAKQGVSQEMVQDLYDAFSQVNMPVDMTTNVVRRVLYLRSLTKIRDGDIPVIASPIHLASGESAHFNVRSVYFKSVYYRYGARGTRPVSGRLVGTNQACYFLSDGGRDSFTMYWGHVAHITGFIAHIRIIVKQGAGGGDYNVPDALFIKTIMDALIRQYKR